MFVGGGAIDLFHTRSFSERGKLCLLLVFGLSLPAVLLPLHNTLNKERRQRTQERESNSAAYSSFSIVALQGNRQVYIDGGAEEARVTFQQFCDLTRDEISSRIKNDIPLPDLIVFPETVCDVPLLSFEGTITLDDLNMTEEDRYLFEDDRWFRNFADNVKTPVLLGLSTWLFEDSLEPIRLNSALFVQPQHGEEPGKMYRYDKMHLVLLGEYVPFAEYLPDNFFLRTLCHEARHGTKPLAIPIGQGSEKKMVEASINICFESSIAHLIRGQILALRNEGHNPRVLINLSNDGWFRFSHAMEQHLATHVFRAVENGMDYITATNGGFSAIIDPYGNIRKIGERSAAEAVNGTIYLNLDRPHSPTIYQKYGDWYALPLALGVLFLVGFSFWVKEQAKNQAG